MPADLEYVFRQLKEIDAMLDQLLEKIAMVRQELKRK